MSYRLVRPFLAALTMAGVALVASGACADEASGTLGADEAARYHAMRLEGRSREVIDALVASPLVLEAKDHRAMAVLALAQLDEGETNDADILLGGIARPYLGDVWEVLLAHANIFMETGQAPRAVALLKRARLKTDRGEVAFALLRATALTNQTDAANDALLEFDDTASVPAGYYARAMGNAVYAHATQRLERGRFDDRTLMLLRRSAEYRPDDPAIPVTTANLLIHLDRTDEAEKEIETIERRFEARMEEALYLRAVIAEKRGDDEDAYRLASDAVHLSARQHIPALAAAGRLGMRLGRLYEARKVLDRLVALSPKHFEGRFLLAQYNLTRAEETETPADVGLYLREAEKNCLHAKVASPFDVANLELLEQVYLKMEARGNKNVDLAGVRRDLVVARRIAERTAANTAKSKGG